MRALLSSLLLCGVLATSCKHLDGFIISGESLNAAGDVFLATADQMEKNHEDGSLSDAQFEKWQLFAAKFKTVYLTAHKLWKLAVATNDAALEGRAMELAASMIPELIEFASSVKVSIGELRK